ncbi:MAG: lactate/malate family dehydrogenase [Vicinamibacterales bacterium]
MPVQMSFVAVLGAGNLGGTLAHSLALRDRVREVRLIDPEERIAQGKALDIRQASPIDGCATLVTAAGSIAAVAGAAVIVVADAASGTGEYAGEEGLTLVRRLNALESGAPIVCAGGSQRDVIGRAVAELHLPASRIVGSAPLALESALRALAGVSLDSSGVPIALSVVGVPPRNAVVAWEEASVSGQPLTANLPAHVIAALNSRIPSLWPPSVYSLASAASCVVEAMVVGSRQRQSCFVAVERGGVASMPVELGPDGVRRVIEPILTRQERTRLENGFGNF